jgi:hypothetical protein
MTSPLYHTRKEVIPRRDAAAFFHTLFRKTVICTPALAVRSKGFIYIITDIRSLTSCDSYVGGVLYDIVM